jgi:hypothetical protein
MHMNVAGWLSEEPATPLEAAQAAERRADAREAAEEREREERRQVAAEQRLEALTFGERAFGAPLAGMAAARAQFERADDELRDLAERVRKAEARRDRARASLEFFAQRAQEASELVSRSAVPANPLEAAVRSAHAEFVRETRQAVSAAAGGRPRPRGSRPFGGRGVAVRSEPVSCQACAAVGASPEESFLIHHSDADGQPVASDPQPVPVPDSTERSGRGGRVIYR